MGLIKSLKIKKALKEIQPEVEKELMSLNLLKVENEKKIYAIGSTNIKWKIQKRILKERYNLDWKSPQDKNPNINYD